MRAPWGFAIKARPLAAFHLVVSGGCELRVDGVDDGIPLHAGDLVVVPNGRAHVARSGSDAKVLYLDDILATHPPTDGRLAYGGRGALTDLVCGGFELTDPEAQPMLSALPPVLHLRAQNGGPDPEIRETIGLVLRELDAPRPGGEAVLVRLTDLLLAQVIRAAVGAHGGRPAAWRDPLVASALAAIDEHPERSWTLAELAALSTLSRSAFAERFHAVTGESPMRYVARIRLLRAAEMLRAGRASVTQISQSTGFSTEASFSRAFRRHFGTAPRTYRRMADATVTSS